MKSVYFQTTDGQWRYDLEDEEYTYIITNLMEDSLPIDEMLEDSLEILRDVSALADDEMDEDDQIDQSVAVAFLWHYFNDLAKDGERIQGDVAVIEDDDGVGISVIAASDLDVEE